MHDWPGFARIDPAGKLVGMRSGEAVYDLFDSCMGKLITTGSGSWISRRGSYHMQVEEEDRGV